MAIFCHAVEAGSFSAAARALQLTPSAVSKQITRLENRLGARLLNRTTRQLRLTEEGRVFFERSKTILAEIDEVEQAVTAAQSRPRGRLRINAPVSFGRRQLVPLMPKFMAANPEIEIELELTDRTVNPLEEDVDVLIRTGEMHDSSLVARRLAEVQRYVCAAPQYLSRHGVPRTPEDLLQHNCLLHNHPTRANDWLFNGPDGKVVIRASGTFSANISGVLHTAVLAGIGIARLATFMIGADIKAGRLVPLLTDYDSQPVPLYAVYPHRRHLSPKVRALVDFLIAEYSPHPPWQTKLCKARTQQAQAA